MNKKTKKNLRIKPMLVNPAKKRGIGRYFISSLFNGNKSITLHRIISAGIVFKDKKNPDIRMLEKILKEHGYKSPDDLKKDFIIPREKRLIVRNVSCSKEDVKISSRDKKKILFNALILGLCNDYFYDSSKSVIWTRKSLTRHVELYDPEGFYNE